jgi:very-short-patch-repair endonuclease
MTNRKLTDIESILLGILNEEGIPYVREYGLGTYHVDVYLPCYKLSIQADGEYWHGYCSKCIGDREEASSRQKQRQQKDSACIGFHKRFNLSIIRFCGCELKNEREFVKSLILKTISEIQKGNLVYRKRSLKKDE